jgi:endonuclease III
MTNRTQRSIAAEVGKRAGRTYAEEAGIKLRDTPMPLFELLVLSLLMSARISADIAVAAARELFGADFRSPEKMSKADRADIIKALGRGHYVRYDESTATQLNELSHKMIDTYDGDLRKLAEAADNEVAAARELVQQFNGLGPVGADIFLREVQDVWTWVAPYYDKKARGAAENLGLPDDPALLAELAPGSDAEFAAALVRISLDKDLRESMSP